MELSDERRFLLDELAKVSDSIKGKKELILKLANNIDKSLDSQYIQNIAKILNVKDPKKRDISTLLKRMRDNHFPNISYSWIASVLPQEYKRTEKEELEVNKPVRLTPTYIENNIEELKEMIKTYDKSHTPAKDIITKANKDQMEKYTWKCWLAEELAMLAIKLENDHMESHEDKLCKDYAKRAKMVRDSRFATNANAYEAIIVACNSSDSLKNSISGEWEFKNIWEIREDEQKCRECLGIESCIKEKCTHECHRVVRPMTTKGLKYAIKTNDDLNDLDNHIKRLQLMNNDICRIGKILLENPKTKKKLGVTGIKRLIYSHIDKDDCLQCDLFLDKNPLFFDKWE